MERLMKIKVGQYYIGKRCALLIKVTSIGKYEIYCVGVKYYLSGGTVNLKEKYPIRITRHCFLDGYRRISLLERILTYGA